jgi:Ca2+-binding EF-hand superfamily protein
LSQKYAADTHLHDAVGTVYSMAPELLGRDYDSKVDVWSLGVIAFMLLSSSMPFYGKDRVQVIKRIIRGKYQFSSRRWRYISTAAKGFCERLLMVDPEERPTAEQALQYTWVSQDFEDYGAEPDIDAMDNIQAAIQCFAGYRKLKKLALMVVAYKSTSEEIGFLRKMFNRFDKMKDGEISLQEFKEAFSEHYDYTDEELAKLFEGIDIDGTGSVHYSEFLASTIEAHGSIDEERLAEAFDRIDCDDTGYITTNNLKEFLGEDIPEKYLVDIINEADIRQDKKIAYDEFLALWNDDSDQILKSAKIQAEARRATRANSPTISSVPSTEGSTEGLTDSERGRLSDSARNITASLCFEHLKHVEPVESDDPVQSDWV